MELKCLNDYALPKLYISLEAMARVQLIVDLCEKEVGWMGLLRQKETDGRPKFLLDCPYVPSQEVNGATCDLDPDGEGSFFEWAMTLPDEDKPLIKWWGHSHVNMGVSPSGTDMETFWEHVENDPESPFVMTIHNKQGKAFSNVYLGGGLYMKEVEILLDYGLDELRGDVQAQLDNNVREKIHVPKSDKTNGNYSGQQIGFHQSQYYGGGSHWQQPSVTNKPAGNAESNAMGLRPSGEPQPTKSGVQPKGRGKKQGRGNGRKSAA